MSKPEILQVVDTRQFVEQGDRWVPVPGSGDCRKCDRCGRTHEVHATIRLADGTTLVVGTGCMELGSAVARKAASNATTIARLRCELAAARTRLEAASAAQLAVASLTPPEVVQTTHANGYAILQCGDGARIHCQFAHTPVAMAERQATAIRSWRGARYDELCSYNPDSERNEVASLEVRLARAGG